MKEEDERGLSRWIWKCPLNNEFWVKDGTEYKVRYANTELLSKKVKESAFQIFFDQKNNLAIIIYGEKHKNPEELGFTIIKKPCMAKGKKPLRRFRAVRHGRTHMKRIHNVFRIDPPCVKV